MLPLELFRSRQFAAAIVLALVTYAALGGVIFLVVTFLPDRLVGAGGQRQPRKQPVANGQLGRLRVRGGSVRNPVVHSSSFLCDRWPVPGVLAEAEGVAWAGRVGQRADDG